MARTAPTRCSPRYMKSWQGRSAAAARFTLPQALVLDQKARGAIMFEHSLQLAREYADYYWTLDPLCITGWIKKSNRATRVSDLVPYSSFTNSEFVIDFLARVPCYWGLAGLWAVQAIPSVG